ncbi:MAG: hypothetical protein KDB54_04035 [Solirubrobacterales bacterium]|nr:hypothetical protein [Solirubrobacterales bacterium]MCB0859803.1 hypothetical protein [Solirubrobacterales bacterium]
MTHARQLIRRIAGNPEEGTAGRKARLAGLIGVPVAGAFLLGVIIGVIGQSISAGATFILLAIPVAIAGGLLTGRVVLDGAMQLRGSQKAGWLAEKLEPISVVADPDQPARVEIIHPAVDLKHFFGGFIAVFNLARRLGEDGHRVRIVTMEPLELPADWRKRVAAYEGIGNSVEDLEVIDGSDRNVPVRMNPEDRLIATHWTAAHVASGVATSLGRDSFTYLIQEYEPLIFPMGSAAALADQSYELEHTAIFSTDFLRDYFRDQELGVYRPEGPGEEGTAVFSNAITPAAEVTVGELRGRDRRRLLFYARPEAHAERNLFELGVMALDRAVAAGHFKGWDIAGIGNVDGTGELVLPRSKARMRMLPRVAQKEYADTLRLFDVGLALMYTPHPSLVPIEMAAAGLVTVTNTYANKDRDSLEAISTNLIAAEPRIDQIAEALISAEAMSRDFEARVKGSKVDWPDRWDEALDDDTMEQIGHLLD